MAKWWHTLATIGMAVLTVSAPVIQTVISGHKLLTTILVAAWGVLGHLLPSPVATPGS